jgi:hypothetical protein
MLEKAVACLKDITILCGGFCMRRCAARIPHAETGTKERFGRRHKKPNNDRPTRFGAGER